MAGCDVAILTVPAFAHGRYLLAIAPYIKSGVVIAGLPSRVGFEFQCYDILKEKIKSTLLVSFESLPWACRLIDYGNSVRILGTKGSLCASVTGTYQSGRQPLDTLQYLFGKLPVIKQVKNYLDITFLGKSFIHHHYYLLSCSVALKSFSFLRGMERKSISFGKSTNTAVHFSISQRFSDFLM